MLPLPPLQVLLIYIAVSTLTGSLIHHLIH